MNFLLDQDVPDTVGRVLQQSDHDVRLLRDVMPVTATDEQVLAFASENGLILVTCNRDDFLSIAETHAHAGIVVLIRRQTRMSECAALLRLLSHAGEQGIRHIVNFA